MKPRSALRLEPTQSARLGTLLQQAALLHQQGRPYEASALCEQILRAQARHAGAWHLRGLLAIEAGELRQGIDWIEYSLRLQPEQPAAHSNIGNALLTLGETLQALGRFDRALSSKPDYIVALYNRANALQRLRRFSESLQAYERVLRLQPAHVNALNNLGLVLLELGRPDEALSCFERACGLDVRFAAPWVNQAATLLRLDRAVEARQAAEQAVVLAPTDARAWCVYADALRSQGHFEEALGGYERALRFEPSRAEFWAVRGALLQQLERYPEALSDLEQALQLDPTLSDVRYNRAVLLRSLQRPAEAVQAYERLLQLEPEHVYALGNLLQLRLERCDWTGYAQNLESVQKALRRAAGISSPFLLLLLDSPSLQLAGARAYAHKAVSHQAVSSDPEALQRCSSVRSSSGRIRVAYLSADFRDHPVSHALLGVLESHDRERFETIGISFRAADRSMIGQRIRATFEQSFDVEQATDREVAAMLRSLGCDIAIDLMGLTLGHRLGIFAQRAARVQVGYLGYAGTTGTPGLDYLLADEVVIPPGQEAWYSEQVVRLPRCYLPFGDSGWDEVTLTREQAGLPADALVLCGFATAHKLNPPLFDVWMRLLRELPTALLWLRLDEPAARDNLIAEAHRHGVDSQRLVFAPRTSDRAEHLARLPLADLFLDTTPYNAHSTACDALWSGLPLITCAGRTFASRVAASALSSVGLTELVAPDLASYADLAQQLCRTPGRLMQLRERLTDARDHGRMFDRRAYTRALEDAYLEMSART